MPAAPDSRSIRLIHFSLLAGVLLFLAVSLFVRSGSPVSGDSRLPIVLLAASLPPLLLSLVLKSRIPPRRAAEPADEWWQANYVRAVIVWSLIEGASLLGVVAFWVTGQSLPLAATAAGILLFGLTAPGRLASE